MQKHAHICMCINKITLNSKKIFLCHNYTLPFNLIAPSGHLKSAEFLCFDLPYTIPKRIGQRNKRQP